MGTDIHVTIEHQDSNGRWWAVFSKAMYWTDWWTEHVRGIPVTGDHHRHPDFYRQNDQTMVWIRDHDLFAALSNNRGQNALSACLRLDSHDGLANQRIAAWQWPHDASHAATSYYNGDFHSQGVCLWSDLQTWKNLLAGTKRKMAPGAIRQKESVLRWTNDLEKTLALVFGDGRNPARITRPFTYFGTGDDPDGVVIDHFSPQDGVSAHALLAYLEDRSKLTKWQDIPPERLRVLVCYDS